MTNMKRILSKSRKFYQNNGLFSLYFRILGQLRGGADNEVSSFAELAWLSAYRVACQRLLQFLRLLAFQCLVLFLFQS